MSRRHWGRTLAGMGRLTERLVPSEQRQWVRAWSAELDEIENARSSLRWLLGSGRIVARGWMAAMGEEAVMKTVLTTLSVVNLLMGSALLGLVAFTADTPPLVAALGIGLLVQASYTIAYMIGRLDRFQPWSLRALLAGQTVSLLIGFFGFVSSALYNINPPNGDYEYGPLTVGALIAFQAAAALWVFVPREGQVRSV